MPRSGTPDGKRHDLQAFQGRETTADVLRILPGTPAYRSLSDSRFDSRASITFFRIRIYVCFRACRRPKSAGAGTVASGSRGHVFVSQGCDSFARPERCQTAVSKSAAAAGVSRELFSFAFGITEQGKTLAQTLSSLNQPVSDTSGFFLQLSPRDAAGTAAVYRSGHAALDTKTSLVDLYNAARPVPPPLFGLRDSAYGAGGALDQMTAKIASLQMPTLSVTTDDQGNQRAVYSVPSHCGRRYRRASRVRLSTRRQRDHAGTDNAWAAGF